MTGAPPDLDYDDDLDDPDLSDEEMALDECGLMSDGHCSLAGTEWCDWSCPVNHEAAHNKAVKRGRRR